jgi:hypothetical protein
MSAESVCEAAIKTARDGLNGPIVKSAETIAAAQVQALVGVSLAIVELADAVRAAVGLLPQPGDTE